MTRRLKIAQLQILEDSRTPYWLFDIDRGVITWANTAALDLWRSTSLQELTARNFAEDMSSSIRARLKQYQTDFAHGEIFDELWTIYPLDEPISLMCRFRGIELADRRTAMLCEGSELADDAQTLVQGHQALLYTSAIVSTYGPNGSCRYMNPAARRTFAPVAKKLHDRIADDKLVTAILEFNHEISEGRFTTDVLTRFGKRTHEIEVRITRDADRGDQVVVVTEVDISEKEKAKAESAFLAFHDPLTALGNRALFRQKAVKHLQSHRKCDPPLYLCFLDLDRFKYVNDTLGHLAGDQLLKEVAGRLREHLPSDCLLSRLGGDEFAILTEGSGKDGLSDLLSFRAFTDGIEALFKDWFTVENHQLKVDVSIGVCCFPTQASIFSDLLRKADLALYAAKEGGGGTVVYQPQLEDKSRRFLSLDSKLRKGLAEGELELFFQPRVELATNRVVGAEALLRWRNDEGEVAGPDEFIPVAEATGLIDELGLYVLREAFARQLQLLENGKRCSLSVNVAARQFGDPNLLPLLRHFAQHPHFDTRFFELEITESMLVADDPYLGRTIAEIADLGYPLVIDDFGTAYSNMAALTQYPIEGIKIDRTLIGSEDLPSLALGVLTIGKALGVKIIAEGVETDEQRVWLAENGCHEFQGFLFSRALPFEEFAALLAAPSGRTAIH